MGNKRVHIFVEGHVQGVGFRYYTKDSALRYGIVGWVRNTYKNEVEICAEGSADQIEKFLIAVRHGPPSSIVLNLRLKWEEPIGDFKSFKIGSTI